MRIFFRLFLFVAALLVLVAMPGAVFAGSLEDAIDAQNKGDYTSALRLYRPLAEQGDRDAQDNIGGLYFNGQGTLQDYVEAMWWFRKAAEQGDADAQYNIGVMYGTGQGVPQDYVEAMLWYRKAAKQGHPGANYNIGAIYFNGLGVTIDRGQAIVWIREAAKLGDQLAQTKLKEIEAEGTPTTNGHTPLLSKGGFRTLDVPGKCLLVTILGENRGNRCSVTYTKMDNNTDAIEVWITQSGEPGRGDELDSRDDVVLSFLGYPTGLVGGVDPLKLSGKVLYGLLKIGPRRTDASVLAQMGEYFFVIKASALEQKVESFASVRGPLPSIRTDKRIINEYYTVIPNPKSNTVHVMWSTLGFCFGNRNAYGGWILECKVFTPQLTRLQFISYGSLPLAVP